MNGIQNGNGVASYKNGIPNGVPKNKGNQEEIDLLTTSNYSYDMLMETANFIMEKVTIRPSIGIICGSGMGSLANNLTKKTCFPYEDIPNFPVSTVEGHIGQLVFGYLENIPVLCMQGRFHYYEGYPLWKCCMPVRIMKLLGITHLIATNAAGGLNPKFKVGDIMFIKDHVNFMGFAGNNPLQGPNENRFGPRFPSMCRAYDKTLRETAKKVVKELDMDSITHEGVYTCLGGPSFETVAELKMLRMLGVDAVGMSTIHEVITARHCDIIVFAFSLITNECETEYEGSKEANHEEVMDVGKTSEKKLMRFVSQIVKEISNKPQLQNKYTH